MAFQTALSGLNAAQANLSVTGNNIANSSTNGFKRSRAEFADIFATTFSGATSTAIGSGVRLARVAQQFTGGNVEFTDNNLDLAINGEGFFIVKDTDGSTQYTRAGAYGVDREGYVINSKNQRLQMYNVDESTGTVVNYTPTDLWLDTGAIEANSTGTVDLNVNLNADAAVPTTPWATPPTTAMYNFSTSTTIYDSLGGAHTMTLYFLKTGNPNEWTVYGSAVDATGATIYDAPQTINYDTTGQLTTAMPLSFFGGGAKDPVTGLPVGGTFDPQNGAEPFGFYLDLTGSTQYAGNSNVNSLVQDGYTTGRISSIDIDSKGVVFARYTNGQSKTLGAVAMANFANVQGLQPVGDNNWVQTYSSGDVIYGQAGTGTMGQMQSGALEASNVDLSKQLVNMIVAQRDFQANAKMISTEDQITQTIINIR